MAGPVATRTLAGFGAQVLRIDPPGWHEANVVPDITLGKRCSFLDLNTPVNRRTFETLISEADVLVHGYRPGALDQLGYDKNTRCRLNANLIEVCLDAYGWSGPWALRRGFDSLVQMSSGIAHQGMQWCKTEKPTPLPVQALDHGTGYLMAAAVLRLLSQAVSAQTIGSAKLSLARTAQLLFNHTQKTQGNLREIPMSRDLLTEYEITPWGKARRLKPALTIVGTPMGWSSAACDLGSSPAVWL